MTQFTDSQIAQIREGSISILDNIGVKVPRKDLLEKLKQKGFRVNGEFVLIEKKQVLDKIEAFAGDVEPPEPVRPFITYTSAYSHTYEKIDGSGFESITNESNAAMGRFINNTSKIWTGLQPNCPGHPTDVHPDLQFFRLAINSFTWCEGFHSMEPVSLKIAPYQFEACEVVGRPMNGLPIYVASPLTIAGESFDIAVAHSNKLESAWVGSMPSLGANTPLNLIAAYAQTAAETIGGAIVFEELTGVPTSFSSNIFTFDFHSMSMPFGTPEKLVLEWLNMDVAARLGGGTCKAVWSTDIHSNAIHSGMQACVEKASLAMAGALRGAQSFGCSGTLGMDEMFSPVQLLIDLEMLEHIQHIIDGMPIEEFEGDLLEEVREGVKFGYLGSDRTLNNYKDYQWFPHFFNRHSFGSYLKSVFPTETEKARQKARELMNQEFSWKLDEDKCKELERIYRSAEKSLG